MQDLKSKVNDLGEDVEAYLEAYYELKVLKLSEKASLIASQGITVSLLVLLGIFVLAFSGIAMAWWIGLKLDNIVAGFFLVAGLYLFIFLILIAFRKKVIIPGFRNMIIKKMYEEYDN